MGGFYRTYKSKASVVQKIPRNSQLTGFSRKGETALLVILVIIIVLLFFGWLINVSQRECRSNRDCGAEAYCGSDFACHSYPTIQKTVVEYNLFWPAVIIAIAIVIAAWIFKGAEIRPRSEAKQVEQSQKVKAQEVEDISEPYYKSDSNIRTP